MIKDNLEHISYYNYLTSELQLGLKYLKDNDFVSFENGKYEIMEDKVFAIVQDYDTKSESEGKFEAHKKYIDIQFVAQGEEKILTGRLEEFDEITEYDEEKDIIFLEKKDEAKIDTVRLKAGEYVIFTPNDVHMPSLTVAEQVHVKKVVIKVLAS